MKLNKITLLLSSVLAVTACGTEDGETLSTTVAPSNPGNAQASSAKPTVGVELNQASGQVDFGNVSVHDPSVVEDNGTFYIFGSHLAAAKTTDFINWSYIERDGIKADITKVDNPLFNDPEGDDAFTQLQNSFDWTGEQKQWAADAIKLGDKYYYYYNQGVIASEAEPNPGGKWGSWGYLGVAVADNIEGPYSDLGPIVKSHGGLKVNGEVVSDVTTVEPDADPDYSNNMHPNAVDPDVFYDKDGKLWMVYGSYSGGIFIYEMDEATGKPIAGKYEGENKYGKRIMGGDHATMEGAFILHSPETDYYYMFISFGGLGLDGGYNVRVVRSKNPDGPYYDPAGRDMGQTPGTLDIGGKLVGGFEFSQELAEESPAWGYLSPGHNSAYIDDEGRHLLIFHTRFPATSSPYPNLADAHEVRVHQMFFNSEGWPVVSPQRFVPVEGENNINADNVTGYYQFVNHGNEVNTSAIPSGHIALLEDHTITGSETGTWHMIGESQVVLKLESGTYNGVAKWQWDNRKKEVVPVISALSNEGASVWLIKSSEIDETSAVIEEIYNALTLPTEFNLSNENYKVPTVAKNGAKIIWESSDEYYISNDGSIFIPTPDRGDQTVNLVATINLGGQSTTKSFTVDLKARPAFKNAVAHYTFEDTLTDSRGNLADASATDNNMDNLDAGTASFVDGQSGKAFSFDGATGVRLPDDFVNSDAYTISFWMNPSELTGYTPAFFAAVADDRWLSVIPAGATHFTDNMVVWSKNVADEDWNQIIGTEPAPIDTWTHVALTYRDGTMSTYLDGNLIGSMPRPDFFTELTGNFALGVNYGWDTPFKGKIDEVIVYDYALSSLDINGAAKNNLTNPDDFADVIKAALDLGDTSAVRESFDLLRVGPFVSGISWVSDNPDYLAVKNGRAIVTQPSGELGDQEATLTATITFEKADGSFYTDTKVFDVTIKSLAPAEYSFEGDLTTIGDAAEPGTVTGNRIDNADGAISYVEGVKGNALMLDGTSGVRLPDNLITTFDYAVSMWLKPTVITDYTTAFFGAANTSSWVSFVPSAGGPTRLWSGEAWYDAEPGGTIPANEWTHVAFSIANGDVNLYLNGELKFNGTGYPNVFGAGGTTSFALGVNYWDTPYNGAIDELKIFGNSISQGKVSELFAEGELPVEE